MTPTGDQTAAPAPQEVTRKPAVSRKLVPIDRISADLSLQVRGGTDPSIVKEYVVIIKEHGQMDAVDLFFELGEPITTETKFSIADGFHRLEAYRICGIEKIPANLRPGSHSDAIRFALQRNGHHGKAPTNAEKRSMAEHAVIDPEVGVLTDREIAAMIGCSASLISTARRGESRAASTAKKKEPVKKQERVAPEPKATKDKVDPMLSGAGLKKSQILRQVQDYLDNEVIEESDLLKLVGPGGGAEVTLKVVGPSGRAQVELACIVKQITLDTIVLRNDGGKIGVVG